MIFVVVGLFSESYTGNVHDFCDTATNENNLEGLIEAYLDIVHNH